MQERKFIPLEDKDVHYYKEESKDYLESDENIAFDLEQSILRMARQGASYKQIRLSLGNPSRQIIRNIIKRKDPELFKVLGNTKAVDRLREERLEQSEEEDGQDERD